MAKRPGRRRRGKKDVILDFTKRAKISKSKLSTELDECQIGANNQTIEELQDATTKRAKKSANKLTLVTGSSDYGGNLALPEKVAQRDYESTGQFFRRLDRLVAKAKVEASLESRFDMVLSKNPNDRNDNKAALQRRKDEQKFVEAKLSKHKRNKRKRGR